MKNLIFAFWICKRYIWCFRSLKDSVILLMEEILHHLTCMQPSKYWDIYGYLPYQLVSRMFSINSIPCKFDGWLVGLYGSLY